MLIWIGKHRREDCGATQAQVCERCHNYVRYNLVRQHRMVSFNFIPLFAIGNNWRLECPICGHGQELVGEEIETQKRAALLAAAHAYATKEEGDTHVPVVRPRSLATMPSSFTAERQSQAGTTANNAGGRKLRLKVAAIVVAALVAVVVVCVAIIAPKNAPASSSSDSPSTQAIPRPERLRHGGGAGIARTSAWWSSEIDTAMRSLCRSRTPKPKAQGSTNNAPPTHSRVNARPEKRTMHNQYPPTSYPSYTLSLNRPSLARRGVRAVPVVALLLLAIGSVGFTRAQTPTPPSPAAKTPKVEVKDDRFTDTHTVTLSKQRITDELTLSLKAEVKPSELHGINRALEESPYVYVTFERNAATGHQYSKRDGQVNFLVDGERVAGGPAHSDAFNDNRYHPGQEIVTGIIHLDALQKVARGKRVEMKLQETIITLDEGVLKNLRAFVVAATR